MVRRGCSVTTESQGRPHDARPTRCPCRHERHVLLRRLAFDRGEGKPSTIFVARYMDLNNVEAGDPVFISEYHHRRSRYRDTVSGQDGARHGHPADTRPAARSMCRYGRTRSPRHSRRNVLRGLHRLHRVGCDGIADPVFKVHDCGATWSPQPRVLSTGGVWFRNAQIAVSPLTGDVVLSLRSSATSRRKMPVMVVKSTDRWWTFGSLSRLGHPAFFDAQFPIPVQDQRIPDDGGRRRGPGLYRLDRTRPVPLSVQPRYR